MSNRDVYRNHYKIFDYSTNDSDDDNYDYSDNDSRPTSSGIIDELIRNNPIFPESIINNFLDVPDHIGDALTFNIPRKVKFKIIKSGEWNLYKMSLHNIEQWYSSY